MSPTKDHAPDITYHNLESIDKLTLLKITRKGLPFNSFQQISHELCFSQKEWAGFLNISIRTMQRYQKNDLTFDQILSERIIEITLLYKNGIQTFEDKGNFESWLKSENVALGNVKPIDLLDSSFGIQMVRDELMRIEHGILA